MQSSLNTLHPRPQLTRSDSGHVLRDRYGSIEDVLRTIREVQSGNHAVDTARLS